MRYTPSMVRLKVISVQRNDPSEKEPIGNESKKNNMKMPMFPMDR